MSGLYNTSSGGDAALMSPSLIRRYVAVEQDSIMMVQVGVAFAIFYAAGCVWKSSKVSTSTVLLFAVTCVLNPHCTRQILQWALSKSIGTYLIGTLLLQMGVATKLTSVKQMQDSPSFAQPDRHLNPRLFPCRTTHTRLFPTRHSFSYSYLLVGIPVGWQGIASSMLSADGAFGHRTWFTVNADDYLARGSHKAGLQGKLEEYLSSQNVPANQFASAYLVTAPRFLGFSFNPVSFWYLYNHNGQLSAMILEVNNTFDERRMYFMERDDSSVDSPTKAFSTAWPKDFHVSPFNDRDGSYSLTAKDVKAGTSTSSVDNNIVLLSDEGKAKIIARVYSTESGLDPNDMSRFLILSFLRQWWWVGFMTNPRILREARLLWVKGLQVFYRPEVFKSSIGRNETQEESRIEPHFRAFLTKLASIQKQPTIISYVSAAGPDRGRTIRLNDCAHTNLNSDRRTVDIHILTPAFYSEIVCATSISDTFLRYCFESSKGEAMVHASDLQVLQKMLSEFTPAGTSRHEFSRRERCLFHARRDVPLFNFLFGLVVLSIRIKLRKELRPSAFDCFVEGNSTQLEYRAYSKVALQILLAKRLALGFGWILNLYKHLLNLVLIWRISSLVTRSWLQNFDDAMMFSFLAHTVIYHTVQAFLLV